MDDTYYEKCLHCHLFVMLNDEGLAYEHLHRDDEADTALDESHEAQPSGQIATLLTWKIHGPTAMRERFYA